MRAETIYYLRSKVHFTNPFMSEVPSEYMFPFVLVHWPPAPCETPSVWPLSCARFLTAAPSH